MISSTPAASEQLNRNMQLKIWSMHTTKLLKKTKIQSTRQPTATSTTVLTIDGVREGSPKANVSGRVTVAADKTKLGR